MKKVCFDGPGHWLLAFGHDIPLGEAVEMSDEQAEQLAADPYVQVTVTTVKPAARKGEGQPTDPAEKE